MRICLKVDIENAIGYREGLPALLNLFDQYNIRAAFFFSLGFDNSGLRLRQFFNPWILTKQLPVSHFFYGTLLPPVRLSKKFKSLVKSCAEAGHDIGIKSFDAVTWQSQAINADKKWTENMLGWSIEAFSDIFGFAPRFHSASGSIVNRHLLELEDQLGFELGLDSRGKSAFNPEYLGYMAKTRQLPVTLPAIEELLISPDVTLNNVHEYLFADSQKQLPHGHVFEIKAAHEGRDWLPILEKLLVMWRGFQWEYQSLSSVSRSLNQEQLLTHNLGWANYPPDRLYKATQGEVVANHT